MSKVTQSYKAIGVFDLFLNVVGISLSQKPDQKHHMQETTCGKQDSGWDARQTFSHFWGDSLFLSVGFVGFFVLVFFSRLLKSETVQSLLAKETNSIIADFLPI